MNFEIFVDGQPLVKLDFNLPVLARVLKDSANGQDVADAESTPATEDQMEDLLSRIDERSAQFLKAIAASETGSISWKRMREIYGIKKEDDWGAYSGSFGKGITRAYRNILGSKTARLVCWNDDVWAVEEWDSDLCCVYIDGPALTALRAATGN